MQKKEPSNRIILKCDIYGKLTEVFLDTGALLENVKLPVGFHSLVSQVSIKTLGSFWNSILQNRMEENTIIGLRHEDKLVNYVCSGYLLQDTILICGTTEWTSTEKALEDIMKINSEQTNEIRLIKKKLVSVRKDTDKMQLNEAILNDFSALNNELINNKRDLIRKNQKIESLNQELKAANESLRMFTYSVSHDLREPVRMIKSFLGLLNKKLGATLDQKEQTYMDFAMDGADRLSNMLTDLLEYHRSSNSAPKESVNLNELVLEVKQILGKEIEERRAQVFYEKLPIISGSKAGYRQVIQNLVANSIKFVGDGKAPIISILVEEKADYYILKVKDNGIGIPENQNQEVFNMFKRLNGNEEYKGTGMGLAIVKKTVETLGGKIWVESALEKGSTFYFTIPKS